MVEKGLIKEDHITVYAQIRGTPDGGYLVPASTRAEITATGQWLTHRHGSGGWCGPEGNGVPSNMGDAEGCLLVKIVIPNRHQQYVGFKKDQAVNADGECYLTFHPNDDDLSDNDGKLDVFIKIYKI